MTPLLLLACADVTVMEGTIRTGGSGSWTERQTFDDQGRLLHRAIEDDSPDDYAWTYIEGHAHPVSEERFAGRDTFYRTEWALDSRGRPVHGSTEWPDGAFNEFEPSWTWTWTDNRVDFADNQTGRSTTVFDDQGRPLSQTWSYNGQPYSTETWTWEGDVAWRERILRDQLDFTAEEHWEDGRRVYFRLENPQGGITEQTWTWDGDRPLTQTYASWSETSEGGIDARRDFTWSDTGVVIEGHANHLTFIEEWSGPGVPHTTFHDVNVEPPTVCLPETRC